MKINIEKIGEFDLLDKSYLSDSIFRFRLDTKVRFSEKLVELKKALNVPNKRSILHLENVIKKNNYQKIGTIEELMIKDLRHALCADYYFTNGQKIISLSKNEDGWEIGNFGELFDFQNVISRHNPLTTFGLKSMNLESYKIYEQAEVSIVEELREMKFGKTKMEKLPLTNSKEIRVQEIYPYSKKVYFENNEIQTYQSDELDDLSRQIEKRTVPAKLRTCLNCSNFMFSGMSHDSTGGEIGYCNFFRDQIQDKSVRKTTTHIWSWCNKFKEKKN